MVTGEVAQAASHRVASTANKRITASISSSYPSLSIMPPTGEHTLLHDQSSLVLSLVASSWQKNFSSARLKRLKSGDKRKTVALTDRVALKNRGGRLCPSNASATSTQAKLPTRPCLKNSIAAGAMERRGPKVP